jgi:hypothetical protein
MQNPYVRLCLWILVLFGVSACRPTNRDGFAIYLLADPVSVSEMASREIGSLVLQDQPLIRQGDIISYNWERHAIQLTENGIDHLSGYEVPVDGLPFVVTVDGQPIYTGALWPSYSSLSYDRVVIDPLIIDAGQTVRLQLGYPENLELFKDEDPRGDPRIEAALRAAGILK